MLGDGLFVICQWLAFWLVAVLPVEVTTNSGETFQADYQGFGEAVLRLDRSGKPAEIVLDDLLSMVAVSPESQTGPTFRVTTVGGSKIAAEEVSIVDGDLVIEPRRQTPLRIPVKKVKAIRFRAAATTTDAAWLGLIQKESRGDTLVIRRPGDRLDPTGGLIEGIAAGKVKFDLDGDSVDAPIERLEGVIFGGTEAIDDTADIRIVDVYGSTWSANSIDATAGPDEPLKVTLTDGVEHQIPVHQLVSLRLSGGLVLLANESPAESSVTPTIGTKVDPKRFSALFAASSSQSSSPGDSASEGDLVLHGGSSVEYRIPGGYATLVGAVVRDPSVTQAGDVSMRVLVDGKVVFNEALSDGQPRGFELDVSTARRISIEVGDDLENGKGGDGDLGDIVRVLRPRLLK